MQRKWVIVGFALLLATIVVACGDQESDSGAKKEGASIIGSADDVQTVTLKAANYSFHQTEIRVKRGQTVKLTLENSEGIHGVEIPDLNVKLDSPGSTEFVVHDAGSYEYRCSILCGVGHHEMTGKLIVE